MTANRIIDLSEKQVVDKLNEFIQSCDTDELADVLGYVFGGKCFYAYDPDCVLPHAEGHYEFVPNENYMGAFDE